MRAISVRQPYAWAIIHCGKDVENRNQRAALQFKPAIGERVLIHASKGMTAAEYENAAAFMASIGVRCPQREALQFGGVIGSVLVRDLVPQRQPMVPKLRDRCCVLPRKTPAVHACERPAPPVLGPAMIRIAISQAAFAAIAATLPLGA
jgi:hypothetical protein